DLGDRLPDLHRALGAHSRLRLHWMLVLGVKGNAWAWRNGRWDSVEHFKRVQRRWAIWGAVIWLAVPALFGAGIGGIFFGLKHSAAYEMAATKLQADAMAVNVLATQSRPAHRSAKSRSMARPERR